jgi:hypothetical protein
MNFLNRIIKKIMPPKTTGITMLGADGKPDSRQPLTNVGMDYHANDAIQPGAPGPVPDAPVYEATKDVLELIDLFSTLKPEERLAFTQKAMGKFCFGCGETFKNGQTSCLACRGE